MCYLCVTKEKRNKRGGNSVNTAKIFMNIEYKRRHINLEFSQLVHGDYKTVGTRHELRQVVWDIFRDIYNESVTISLFGQTITLNAKHSLSGKITIYEGSLTAEQFIKITGCDFGLSKKVQPSISISFGECKVFGGGKFYQVIKNEDIIIRNGKSKKHV